MTKKIIFTWSGGKDSAMALYELQKNKNYEIIALLTTITVDYDRISMHGVRKLLLEQQAESLGLPLEKIYISKNSGNEEYEEKMKDALVSYWDKGVSSVAFGDIFLEDLRRYREENLSRIGLRGIFPLWKRNTAELAQAFIGLGFKAIISCIDSKFLDKNFAGKRFDKEFLSEIPPEVDPCGENGEFHSFVFGGSIFKKEVSCKKGEVILRDNRFYYCDLLPVNKNSN